MVQSSCKTWVKLNVYSMLLLKKSCEQNFVIEIGNIVEEEKERKVIDLCKPAVIKGNERQHWEG